MSHSRKKKILVGMSGGVDSSVAAVLLIERGFEVTGGFIKNWSDTCDLWTGECQWRGERRDALRVAAHLGISLLTFDFEKEYRERVVARLFDGYARGITPNPDVLCNQEIKFGLFFDEAMRLGFDGVATGHYARIVERGACPEASSGCRLNRRQSVERQNEKNEGRVRLLKGVDKEKDQSYFLHRVSREALAKTIFPVGEMTKKEVRREAERLGLPTAKKPDSQGICFIGKTDFHDFLRKKIPPTPGEIITPEGEVIGHHDGLDAATIGQRQGLGISKDHRVWYVAAKDRARNRLIVVPDRHHPLLWKKEIVIQDAHWINQPRGEKVDVVIRYRSEPVSCRIIKNQRKVGRTRDKESEDRDKKPASSFQLLASSPLWAPAPGQSAVFYQGEECLGGGVIVE